MEKSEIEDIVFPEFFLNEGGANMVYYGRCDNGK